MSLVVVINGPAGGGKTTVSRLLAQRHPGTINIAGDALRHFAPQEVRDFLGTGSTYRFGAELAAAYLAMGAAQVLFDYVFDDARKLDPVLQRATSRNADLCLCAQGANRSRHRSGSEPHGARANGPCCRANVRSDRAEPA